MGVAIGLLSCTTKDNTTTLSLEEQLDALTMQYVQQELHLDRVDSIQVLKVDTITLKGYVQINSDLLERYGAVTAQALQEAMMSEDTLLVNECDINLSLVRDALSQWSEFERAIPLSADTIYRYLITANYYAPSGVDQFYYFLTPNLVYYVLDPFGDELIQ